MKKIMTVFIILLLCFHATATSFSDIRCEDLKKAVDTLSSYGIINGYEDGTFKPDSNITRAEFAKIITVATRLENTMPLDTGSFQDVQTDVWYEAYVYVAKSIGIIHGTTETTFEPTAFITYEQAIKMIVAALGYNTEAQQQGGYPQGYIKIADTLGITANVEYIGTEYATRGNIARLVNNALHAEFYYLILSETEVERFKADRTLLELHEASLEINNLISDVKPEDSV